MLKKSLIAIALASVSTVATAGTVSLNHDTTFAALTAADISVEGYAAASNKKLEAGNGLAADSLVTIKADTAYVANDVVLLTVENGSFDTTVTSPTVSTSVTVAGVADGTPKASVLDYLNSTTLRLRLGDAIPEDGVIRIAGLKIIPASTADKDVVKLNSSVLSSNATIGTYDKGTAVTVAEFSQEFVLGTVVKFNGQVSTGKGRQEFTGTSNLEDQVKAPISKTPTLELALTATEVNYTLEASNLSFAADYDLTVNGGNADGKLSDAELKKAFATPAAATQTLSINEGYTALTIKDTAAAGLDLTATVIGNAKGGSVLASQGFALTAKVKHANGEFTVKGLDAAAVGGWSLDGSGGDIKFIPFGPQYAQSITVTNSGAVTGEITADIFFNGEKFTKTLSTVAAANSVTNISAEIAALAAENSVVGDARILITVNAPNCNVNAVFYHKGDGDRVKTQ